MTTRVTIDASTWPTASDHLTGLTGRFRLAAPHEPPPRVSVVDGSRAGWPLAAERAAASAAAVLVVDPDISPSRVTLDELEGLAQRIQGSAALVLADPWVQASSLEAVRVAWAAIGDDEPAFIDLVATGEVRLARLLAVLYAGMGILPSLVALELRENAVLASGRTDSGVPILVRALSTRDEPRCTVTAVLRGGAITWEHPGRGDAAPSTLSVSGPEGTRLLPTVYASPYRQALLRVHLAAIGPGDGGIDELSAALEVRRHLDAELLRLRSSLPSADASPTEVDTP